MNLDTGSVINAHRADAQNIHSEHIPGGWPAGKWESVLRAFLHGWSSAPLDGSMCG
jgi:hypothetical protein